MRTLRLIAAILAMATLLAVPVAYGDTDMTSQRNPFARQAEVRQNLDRLINPGVQANLVGRTNQNVGTVKADTRQISATSFVADVEIQTRFNGATVTIPSVRFNVPVSEGDVVSLEIVGGHPLNGVFGTPIKPKGPNILTFDGPTNAAEWAADESAPSNQRARNELYQSYVLPIQRSTLPANANTPWSITTTSDETLLTLPDTFLVLTLPSAAHIEVSGQLHGGLRIVGGGRAGEYPIRIPAGRLSIDSAYIDPDGNFISSQVDTHKGLESARGDGPMRGEYADKLNNPLVTTGNHILYARTIRANPTGVGGGFSIALDSSVLSYDAIEWYRPITHPEHPMSIGHPEHPEYSFWTWESLPTPGTGETFYIWVGLSNVEITVVELGTGGSR